MLCGAHHDIVDANPTQYDAEALRKMKADHESRDLSAPNDIFKRLIEVLAPEVPDNWWERPGAPHFRLNLGSYRPKGGEPWVYSVSVDQVTGTDIGNLRYGYGPGSGEVDLKKPHLEKDRKWRLDDLTVHSRGEPLELVLTFWWDGGQRTARYRWPKESDFQNFDSNKVLTFG